MRVWTATPTTNLLHDAERETPKLQGVNDSLIEFYKRLRPGDPATLDNAKAFMAQLLVYTATL